MYYPVTRATGTGFDRGLNMATRTRTRGFDPGKTHGYTPTRAMHYCQLGPDISMSTELTHCTIPAVRKLL
jgi:hypothetical protein